MAMTIDQFNEWEKHKNIEKNKKDNKQDNYPKCINLSISTINARNDYESASSYATGQYIRQYNDEYDEFYYYNKVYKLYLFIPDDGMWTISKELLFDSKEFLYYCPHSDIKILETPNYKWSDGNNKYNVELTIYKLNSKSINKDTVTSYTQTSINYTKLNKNERNHLRKCGVKNIKYKEIIIKDKDTCSICFESLMFLDKKTELMCGHMFHTQCILPWICKQDTCPNCRHDHKLIKIQ